MFFLLPFKFDYINDKELLVNEFGDFLLLPKGSINKIISKNIKKTESIYKDLIANHFISETAIPYLIDNLATRLRSKKSFLSHFTTLHIFVLTLRCNQNCTYCQASSRDSEIKDSDMQVEDAYRAIDLMFQSPSSNLTVEFQGGEPTLAFGLLKRIIARIKTININHNKSITYVLCSNSIQLSDEMLEFCKENRILLSTSLDGPEFLHNKNRGKIDSYKKVLQGINKARDAIGSENISALMTTSVISLDYYKEIIDSYLENGFQSIFIRPLNPYGLASNQKNWNIYTEKFIEFYKRSLSYIIQLNENGTLFIEEFTSILLKKILTPFNTGFVDLQSPSGIINSVIVYNYDGYVYASDEARMLAENRDYTFRLGHVSNTYEKIFYGTKAQSIADTWCTEYIAGCADCAFQAYCGADPIRNYTTQGSLYGFRPNSLFCKKHKAIIKHLFEIIENEPNRILPIFKQWLNNNEN